MSAEIKQQRPLPATLHWPNHGNPLIIDIHKKSLVARIGRHRSQSDATHPTHTPHADMFCVFNGIHLPEVHMEAMHTFIGSQQSSHHSFSRIHGNCWPSISYFDR